MKSNEKRISSHAEVLTVKIPALERLIKVVASGIGSVAGPMLAPWRANREGEAEVILAQARAKVLLIESEAHRKARDYLIPEDAHNISQLDFGSLVRERVKYQEQKRLANVQAVTAKAAVMLEGVQVEDAEPDHYWTARFFNDVQDVSSDDLQDLWAKVLSGEVKRGGSTSLRALDILKNIDARTAHLFGLFCSVAIYLTEEDGHVTDARVPSLGGEASQNALEPFGLGFGDLNRLNEHGLIISDYNSFFDYVVERDLDGGAELFHQGVRWDWAIQEKDKQTKTVRIHGVAMTVSGAELAQAIPQVAMTAYTNQLKKFLSNRFKVDMVRIDETTGQKL